MDVEWIVVGTWMLKLENMILEVDQSLVELWSLWPF